MIWGTVAHTPAQSWVSYISHGSPAVAGSCDKWLTLDCVWMCCAPHMSIHYCHYYHYQYHCFICGSLMPSHSLVCLNSVLHWVHYECTCCIALVVGKNNHKLYAILKVSVKITSYRGPNKHVLLQYPSSLQNTCVYVCMFVSWKYWCICGNKPFFNWIFWMSMGNSCLVTTMKVDPR